MSERPDAAESSRFGHVLAIVLTNERRELVRLGDRVEQFGKDCGLDPDDTAVANLVLDELVSNVIKYAYDDGQEHQILVTVEIRPDLLIISVEDDGKPFNPTEAPAPNLGLPVEEWPLGGLGVHIVKSIANAIEYRRDRDRNIVRVEKTLSAQLRQNDHEDRSG
jgi:anti-sigma regulatory factor (Ser/Thr protein kinase)